MDATSNKKIGILTYHHAANNGGVLQAYSVWRSLQDSLPDFDVKVIDYRSRSLELHEKLKCVKPYKQSTLFGLRRYLMFQGFIGNTLPIDKSGPQSSNLGEWLEYFSGNTFDALIVGSDNIWQIRDKRFHPKFPNIYWLSPHISVPKFAYAVSAYRSDPDLVRKYQRDLSKHINAFDLIGIRDKLTWDIIDQCRPDSWEKIYRVPDPTFMMQIPKTSVADKLDSLNIDLKKPLLGILIYGKDNLSQQIRSHFKEKGYQIIALSMFNPYADLNLGHILNPFEWADVFKHLTFCITDRFHGSIFCLKNRTPFLCFEPTPIDSTDYSKIYSMLTDIDFTEPYFDVYQEPLMFEQITNKVNELQNTWLGYINRIESGLQKMKDKNLAYIRLIKKVLQK